MIQPPCQTASCMRAGTRLSPLVPSLYLAQGYCLWSTVGLRVSEIRQVLVSWSTLVLEGHRHPHLRSTETHATGPHALKERVVAGVLGARAPGDLPWAGELGRTSLEVTFQQQPKR